MSKLSDLWLVIAFLVLCELLVPFFNRSPIINQGKGINHSFISSPSDNCNFFNFLLYEESANEGEDSKEKGRISFTAFYGIYIYHVLEKFEAQHFIWLICKEKPYISAVPLAMLGFLII